MKKASTMNTTKKKASGAKERSYYQATAAGASEPPKVDFGKPKD